MMIYSFLMSLKDLSFVQFAELCDVFVSNRKLVLIFFHHSIHARLSTLSKTFITAFKDAIMFVKLEVSYSNASLFSLIDEYFF